MVAITVRAMGYASVGARVARSGILGERREGAVVERMRATCLRMREILFSVAACRHGT